MTVEEWLEKEYSVAHLEYVMRKMDIESMMGLMEEYAKAQTEVNKLALGDVSTCGIIQEHQMSDEFRKSIESIDEAMGW